MGKRYTRVLCACCGQSYFVFTCLVPKEAQELEPFPLPRECVMCGGDSATLPEQVGRERVSHRKGNPRGL